jgi:hypothetical protein
LLNLLYIGEDNSTWFARNLYYFEQELSKITNMTVWRSSGDIREILKKIPFKPDFILIQNDVRLAINPAITNLSKISIPTALFVNDTNRLVQERKAFIEENNIRHILPVVRSNFLRFYPQYKSRMHWLPHHVNTDVFKDYNLKRDIPMQMIGAAIEAYPLRRAIVNHYKGNPNFVFYNHPGYRNISKQEEQNLFVGERYAREINRAKIFFACSSELKIPVKKYYEVLACKTLLLADTFEELEALGFIPGKHFVSITASDFKDKAAYYLKNEKERIQIAEQGYKFIQQHSTKKRAAQLVEIMKEIIRNNDGR